MASDIRRDDMEVLRLAGLSKSFGPLTAVKNAHFALESGAFAAILGPSGCGKSTILNMIAGLLHPDSGKLFLMGQDVPKSTPPERRNLGLVLQRASLFPHMSVFENVAYPLRTRGVPRDRIKILVHDILDLMGIGTVVHRMPSELSGGQAQRATLARALVFDAPLVLLDEPLSALDRPLRESLQAELRSLRDRSDETSFLMVTHDREEAMSVADRLVLMEDGEIRQIGPPEEIYWQPACRFVAEFFCNATVIVGEVGDDRVIRAVAEPRTVLHAPYYQGKLRLGTKIGVCILPEGVGFAGPDDNDALPARVEDARFGGASIHLRLDTSLGPINARVASRLSQPIRKGDTFSIRIDPKASWVLPEA
mgnify:CR=1 FL=1